VERFTATKQRLNKRLLRVAEALDIRGATQKRLAVVRALLSEYLRAKV